MLEKRRRHILRGAGTGLHEVAKRIISIARFLLTGLMVIPLMVVPAWAQTDLRFPINDAGIFDPQRGSVSVGYALQKDAAEVTVRIRDFRGQIVHQYRFIELVAGDHEFSWDGNDQNGDPVPEGRYEFLFGVEFKDGTSDQGLVTVRVAALAPQPGVQAPPVLPPETHRYKISGSVSSFWRHDEKTHEDTGQMRARTRFSYADDRLRTEGVLAYIETYPHGHADFEASHAFVEGKWEGGKAKGVFREGLGGFDDPVKLFSDFRTERKKYGGRVEQEWGAFYATALAFGTEGDVDSKETGAAGQVRFGKEKGFQVGAGYTFREAVKTTEDERRVHNQALAADVRIPVLDSLALLVEGIHTRDGERGDDNGYTAILEYDQGRLRASAGYIDLGEDFTADFADPMQGIRTDARGFETSVDYSFAQILKGVRNPVVTLRYFDLEQHSTGDRSREMDTSLRFGVGNRDTFLLRWYGQEEKGRTTNTWLGTATHQWNDSWTSRLQVNRVSAEESGTWRLTLDTTWRQEEQTLRMALEWAQRTIENATRSPYEETSLRVDWTRGDWQVQLHTRYSDNAEEHGTNFFGRVEYRHEFLHRYVLAPYASVGSRSALSFEEVYEVGMEIRF
jgi:hypothetical protein